MFNLDEICDETFFKNYWKKEFFVWKGILKDEDRLLDFKIFNEMINTTDFGYEDILLVDKGKFYSTQELTHKLAINHMHKLHKYDVIDNVKLNKILLLNQYSVRIYSINRYLPMIKRFCEKLETISFRRCDPVTIYTPPNSAGFDWHEDPFEGFAIQLEGAKTWHLCKMGETEEDENYREVTLERGDLIYFPQGIRHSVVTNEQDSLHITFTLSELDLGEMMTALTHNMKCKLFDYPFRYRSDSFEIDKKNTNKYIRDGLIELNSYFSKKSFYQEVVSLLLRGTNKARDFVNLPYKELKDSGSENNDQYRFINCDEIEYFPNTDTKTCLVFRGRSLVVEASVEDCKRLVREGTHNYLDLVEKFNIMNLSDLLAIRMLELV